MLRRPRFKHFYHAEVVSAQGEVYLLSEAETHILRGRLYTKIAPLLDGVRSTDEIVDALEGQVTPAEVYYALARLESDFLVEGDGPLSPHHAAFWEVLGQQPAEVTDRLAATPVRLLSFGSVPADFLESSLREAGIRVSEEGDVTVAVTDDLHNPGLDELNRQMLERSQPWLLVKPWGLIPSIGPLFKPRETGCWKCMSLRSWANRILGDQVLRQSGLVDPINVALSSHPSATRAIASMVSLETCRLLAEGHNRRLEGKVISLDVLSLTTREHVLVRRPDCPACGATPRDLDFLPPPVNLRSQKKVCTADGGHRAQAPEVTFAKFMHHISPITGAVSELVPGHQSDNGPIHVYFAGHNYALTPHLVAAKEKCLRHTSAGKGMSEIQAKTSALCEALERYSGVYRGTEPRRRSSFRSLGERAIHPNDCMNFSEEQFRNRDALNRRGLSFHVVPLPLHEEAEIEWTPLWSLTRREWRYLPTSLCFYSHGDSSRSDFYAWADSNGNASGNTIEEAILQGFFEVVERDATATWWYNRLQRPGVDLESFDEPYIERLRTSYRRHGREIWALDLTSDTNIPTFAAISRRPDDPPEEIVFAFGCHFDARVALVRALAEMNQFLPAALDAPRAKFEYGEATVVEWWTSATVADHPYLLPDNSVPRRRAADFTDISTDDLLTDVDNGRDIVEGLGMEMLVLDQTRSEIGLPVAKVVIPGMRMWWERFRPGRLYDVPVRMKWLREAKSESEMNPLGLFI